MTRVKVVHESSDLVPMLIAVSTETRRKVFNEIVNDWRTMREIEEKYGKKGKDTLMLFEKMRLVETRWQIGKDGKPEKAYRTYYMEYNINTTCPINEMSDVLGVASMPEKEFAKIENEILKLIGKEGRFAGDICDILQISTTYLKSLIKRSSKLEYRGHRIEHYKP